LSEVIEVIADIHGLRAPTCWGGTSDLRTLPYRRVRRPIFPSD
jgi:hypothetical protein